MGILDTLIDAGLRRYTIRLARGKTLQELAHSLAAGAEAVAARMERTADTAGHRRIANHIVGIEGWGQARLRVALGAPLVLDVHQDYLLAGASTVELAAAFRQRRRATLALIEELEHAGVDPATTTVEHNGLGELSVIGWLVYLEKHAERESRFGLRGRAGGADPRSKGLV